MNKIIRWIANALIPITILLFSFEDLNSQRLEKFQFSNLNPVRIVVLNLSFSNYSSLLQGQYALGEVIAKVGLVYIPASKTNALKGAQIIISKFFKVLPSINRWSGLPYLSKLLKDIQQKGDDFFNYISGILKPRGYDALQNHPALRTDVELLKKLDSYLVSDQDADKLKLLLDKLPDDKTRRSAVDDIIKAKRIFDDIYYIQKAEIKKYTGNIISANNNAKGAFGEIASDVALMEREMIPLHNRKRSVQDGWGETGIDGVFKRGNEYFIVEAKYGSATLNPGDISTGLPKQMSDPWIKGATRLLNAVGSQSIVNDILNSGYKRLLAKINQDGSVIYQLLDENATEIGIF